MFEIYNTLFLIIFTPVMGILSLFNKKFKSGLKIKLGNYDFKFEEKTLWLHCVSVGEVMAVEKLVNDLSKNFKIVLTTSTPTGFNIAEKKFGNIAKITYFPFDYRFSVKKAMEAINPKIVLIFETEIWPNFIYEISKQNIPTVIINGRISPRSYKVYKKLGFFFKSILKKYTAFLMQSEKDGKRIIGMGAEPSKVRIMGNIKFDIQKPETGNLKEEIKLGSNRLFIGSSTHEGEEEIVLNLYKKLKEKYSDLKLLLAPRHPERYEKVCELLEKSGFKWSKRTTGANFEDNEIILLDTMGELVKFYSVCHSAFIGGSFTKTGGHNPLEATIFEKPVMSGFNVSNFKKIYKILLEKNCAKVVVDEDELFEKADRILGDDEHYKMVCENCRKVFEDNRGATEFVEKIILSQQI